MVTKAIIGEGHLASFQSVALHTSANPKVSRYAVSYPFPNTSLKPIPPRAAQLAQPVRLESMSTIDIERPSREDPNSSAATVINLVMPLLDKTSLAHVLLVRSGTIHDAAVAYLYRHIQNLMPQPQTGSDRRTLDEIKALKESLVVVPVSSECYPGHSEL